MSLEQYIQKIQNVPKPAETINEGTPIKFILRKFITFNTGASINISKILLAMANSGGGVPRIIWKGSLMVCTLTIHPTKSMNGNTKSGKEIILKKLQVTAYHR